MARSRASAKQAGSSFERLIADALRDALGNEFIDRRVKTGAADRGDIGGVRAHGQRVMVETKNYGGQIKAAEWLREVEVQTGNDDALAGVAIIKKRGVTDPMDQFVLMDVRNFVALITGQPQHGGDAGCDQQQWHDVAN